MIKKSIEILQNLRKQDIFTDIDLLRRGLGKSLKYASSINIEKCIIVGPTELEHDSVTIRDMKTGEQETIKIQNIPKFFK
jgi:histidyl-tRNA synthetase